MRRGQGALLSFFFPLLDAILAYLLHVTPPKGPPAPSPEEKEEQDEAFRGSR